MVTDHPEVTAGSMGKYQSWEVVDPEKWVPDGYACVRVDSRGTGRSPGFLDPVSPAGEPGLLRVHRVGRHPELEQRQGRPQRHLLLRLEPVARRLAAAPAPGRDVPVGGGRRLVPRHDPPRRDPEHLLHDLVPRADPERPARDGGERAAQPQHRGARGRPGDAARRRADPQPRRPRPAGPRAPARRRARAQPFGRLVEGHRSVPVLRELGRPGTPPARQLRGVHAGGVDGEVARGARPGALDALLHRLRPAAAEALLRPLPQGRGQRLERAAARPAAGAAPRRALRRADRAGVAARPHAVDEVLPRRGGGGPDARAARRGVRLLRAAHQRGDHVLDVLRWSRPMEITGPVAATSPLSSATEDADLFLVLRVFDPDGRGGALRRHPRSAHAGGPGLAARVAPQARPRAVAAVPAVPPA